MLERWRLTGLVSEWHYCTPDRRRSRATICSFQKRLIYWKRRLHSAFT